MVSRLGFHYLIQGSLGLWFVVMSCYFSHLIDFSLQVLMSLVYSLRCCIKRAFSLQLFKPRDHVFGFLEISKWLNSTLREFVSWISGDLLGWFKPNWTHLGWISRNRHGRHTWCAQVNFLLSFFFCLFFVCHRYLFNPIQFVLLHRFQSYEVSLLTLWYCRNAGPRPGPPDVEAMWKWLMIIPHVPVVRTPTKHMGRNSHDQRLRKHVANRVKTNYMI